MHAGKLSHEETADITHDDCEFPPAIRFSMATEALQGVLAFQPVETTISHRTIELPDEVMRAMDE